MEQLHQYQQYLSALLNEHRDYFTLLFLVVALCVFYILMYYQPAIKERWMARRTDRKLLAEIVSEALDEARLKGRINFKQCQFGHKTIGKALHTDLIPRPKKVPEKALIKAITRRLYVMGVPVLSKLTAMRRTRKPKKATFVFKPKAS